MGSSAVRLALLVALFAGCGTDVGQTGPKPAPPVAGKVAASPAADRATAGAVAQEAKDASQVSSSAAGLNQPMIIRTGQVSVQVDSLERAIRLITELAGKVGGFIANTSMQTGEGAQRTATLELKLPADRYPGALDQLNAVGKIVSATSNAQDVGEEFVDVSARVTNAKRLEERLLNLLATRTGKLEDVLSVERELARVREEIERYEGRIRYLKAQVAMSTLTITAFEPGPIVGNPGSNVIVEAFKQSWRNLVNATAVVIAGAGALIPVAMVGALVFLGYRRFRRRAPAAV
jgi:hypothetical protein